MLAAAAPAAPANLRGRRWGADEIALAWDAVAGADTYAVYVASSASGPYRVAGTRSAASFTVSNLRAGTGYYFRVSARNAAGYSFSRTLVMPGVPRPAAPTNLRSRIVSPGTIALAWDAAPGADMYVVYVAASPSGPYRVAGTRSAPSFTIGNLAATTPKHYVRIEARNVAGRSFSTTLVVDVRPAAPTRLRARRWADNISLAWDAPRGASTYAIYMATSASGPYTRLNFWPRPSYTVGGVSATTTYYFRVFAGNAAGWSQSYQTFVVPRVAIDPNARPARNPGAPPVGLFGDSVLAALNDLGAEWGNLSAQYDVVANTRICRRLIDVTCDGRGDPSVLTILRSGAYRGDVLIVGVTNSEWAAVFGSAVDQVMAEARRQGFERVIWMTTNRPGSNSAQVNTILRQKTATHADMRIADWAAYSAGHPEWFWGDGVHLRTTAGKLALANMLASQVAAVL